MKTHSHQVLFGATVTHPVGKQLLCPLTQQTPQIATVMGAHGGMSQPEA